MDQREDYADPPPPRATWSWPLIAVIVLFALAAVAAAGWIGLLMLTGQCSKYG
jgi:hypothetical protein